MVNVLLFDSLHQMKIRTLVLITNTEFSNQVNHFFDEKKKEEMKMFKITFFLKKLLISENTNNDNLV